MKRLITSALPYVNNVPHLGNLIQVLSADVFARFCRQRGYETLYVCGTDEYGTATETKALEEGVSPRELCDRFNAIHKDIYAWFGINFDKFGRTSTQRQTEITQGIFLDLEKNGYIKTQTVEQLYCDTCGRFLADRYVRGTCPFCGYEEARGDQCEHCGKLLDPTELINPRCSTCGSTPRLKSTTHLYIDLPSIKPKLESWMKVASKEGFWANNAIQMTQAWMRDGLHPRAITRDLKWGIPVPLKGFEDKVFYVWFDAPIGYISITACLADERGFDWKEWWQNPGEVELFQFIGKDNIPFHTVIFPSSLLGSNRNWTMLHHMSSTEYLNYEAGKFSKSKGIGIFGTDVMETGIPADVWRFYIFWNRPETSDYTFSWADFQEKVNGELIGNLGNLVNRTLTFVTRYYGGIVPAAHPDVRFWDEVRGIEKRATDFLEKADLRDAFRALFELSDLANKHFQEGEPWKMRISNPETAESLLADLCYVIRDIAIMIEPYLPFTSLKISNFLDLEGNGIRKGWNSLGQMQGLTTIKGTEVLFSKLEDETITQLRERYSGSQKERMEREIKNDSSNQIISDTADIASPQKAAAPDSKITNLEPKKPDVDVRTMEERFSSTLDLRVAVITKIERHPKADKLYIETLDDGTGMERTIVSGLVPYYQAETLLGKHIILVNNLKPAKLRGVESVGMLLAASVNGPEGKEKVEVLQAPKAGAGTKVTLEGLIDKSESKGQIDVDTFFSIPIVAKNGEIIVGNTRLIVSGTPIQTEQVLDGEVG